LPKEKRKKQKRFLLFAGLILIVFGLATEAVIFSLRYENLWVWYEGVREVLIQLEDRILELNMSWEFFMAIMALYIVKCIFPIYTTSTVFFITGAVLPMKYSIPINILGTIIQFTIKYFYGQKFGAPYAWKFISKNDKFKEIIESGGKGNPYTLFAMRLIPIVPVNTVSSVYGSFRFGYLRYMGISLLGFLPRIIAYTFVGHNMFDPLSKKFLVPLMLLAFLTGFTMLSANGMWTLIDKFSHMYKDKKAKKAKKSEAALETGE